MEDRFHRKMIRMLFAAYALAIAFPGPARAELTDLADVPLANAPSDTVLPNLMYILDDSGSMADDYMPDNIMNLTAVSSGGVSKTVNNCKTASGGAANIAATQCASLSGSVSTYGEPPYYATRFNQIYYNPDITYSPAVDYTGTSLGNQTATGAVKDAYLNSATVDLTSTYPEAYYCIDLSTVTFTGSISGTTLTATSTPATPIFVNSALSGTSTASFTASFSSTNTMTVSAVSSGTLQVGMTITGSSITNPTTITALGTGTGGTGTYTISRNLSLTSRSVSGSLSWTATVTALGTGTGGTGTYTVTPSQTVPSQSITNNAPSASALLSNTTACRRNGIDNIQAAPNNYFLYWSNNSTPGTPLGAYPNSTGTNSTSFNNLTVSNTGNPFYFTITPDEYCTDHTLVQCTASSTPTGIFTFPAYVRYCGTGANASAASPVSDTAGTTSPKCRAKFDDVNYRIPRYGRFTRTDIVPTTTQYTKSATAARTDCANASYCTYAEEVQNFANWYSYYRTRLAMMKTASGRAFLSIDDRYRVGFITINPNSPVTRATKSSTTSSIKSARYLTIDKFDSTQKSAWYTALYAKSTNGTTPLRQALSRVGRHYAGASVSSSSLNYGMSSGGVADDPIQYSCQQNFSLLTTDGYYNDGTSDAVDYTSAQNPVGNTDNTPSASPPLFVARSNGTLDGSGTTVVTHTPTITLAQSLCYGTSTVSFPGESATTGCGCTSGSTYARIVQSTQAGTIDTTTLDGVYQSTGSTTGTTTFQNISSCAVANITTTVQKIVETESAPCKGGSGSTNFSSGINGNVPSGSKNTTCNCSSSSKYNLVVRTITYNKTTTVTDGVTSVSYSGMVNPPSTNPSFAFTYASGSCLSSSPGAVSAAVQSTTAVSGPTNNGGVTQTVTLSPNPQTSIDNTTPVTTTTSNGGTANTLADVAMYYYKNDLRTSPTWGSNIATDNVPTTSKDIQPAQHMVTFTLGMGVQGLMDYDPNYETQTSGDFANIKAGTLGGCSWTTSGAQCNWPVPTAGTISALDDLWHAAVNGRGVFYSAGDPNSLADGIASALSALHIQTAAAAASATSSPNITQTSNFIYSSTFRTTKWDGEIVAQRIDTSTGNVQSAIEWSAQAQLDATAYTSRKIYFFDSGQTSKLNTFAYANLPSAAQGGVSAVTPYFTNKCLTFSQCSLLTSAQQTTANDGTSLVNYLAGDRTNEGTAFRARDHVLGDPVNATPAFVQAPQQAFADTVTQTYATFKANNASRTPVLYIASNDGMLHAFNGDSAANGGGAELWAYVPRIIMPNMAALATENWDVQHKFSVDGSPIVGDVYDTVHNVWKTILVGGLNKGGRGYYALDVTDPANPKGLWEICSDLTLCAIADTDLGYTYGNPVVTKRASDGKWVVLVSSGMNNVTPGTGGSFLYVLDALNGTILQKIQASDPQSGSSPGCGNTTTPSGLNKIAVFANNFSTDNTGLYAYVGNICGNVWRFDLSQTPTVYPTVQTAGVQLLASLVDGSGNPQSITAKMELGIVSGFRVVFVGTGRYLGSTDLSDPSTLTPVEQWAYQQSVYAIKDKGTNYGNVRTASPGLVQQTLTDTSGNRTISTNSVNWNSKDGWYVDLNPSNTSPGERVNLDLQLQLGTLIVLTNVPNNSACTVGGDSFVYQFNYASGLAISTSPGGLVGAKTTGQIAVGFVVIRLPSGALKQIVTGATGSKTTSAVYTGGVGSAPRRTSWRELLQQ